MDTFEPRVVSTNVTVHEVFCPHPMDRLLQRPASRRAVVRSLREQHRAGLGALRGGSPLTQHHQHQRIPGENSLRDTGGLHSSRQGGGRGEALASSYRLRRHAVRTPSRLDVGPSFDDETGTGVHRAQHAFDDLVREAIPKFAPPQRDELHVTELHAAVRRVDPGFSPEQYNAPDWQLLLRNCKYLRPWRGKLAFVRVRDDSLPQCPTVDLEAYEYQQPADATLKDGVRVGPGRMSSRDLRWK
jgi:hypothetical protein